MIHSRQIRGVATSIYALRVFSLILIPALLYSILSLSTCLVPLNMPTQYPPEPMPKPAILVHRSIHSLTLLGSLFCCSETENQYLAVPAKKSAKNPPRREREREEESKVSWYWQTLFLTLYRTLTQEKEGRHSISISLLTTTK